MKNDTQKSHSSQRYLLTNLVRKSDDPINDDDFFTEDSIKNKKKHITINEVIMQQMREIIEQNELYWSINQINRYLQSPNHFKVMYNIKMKVFFASNGIVKFIRRKIFGQAYYNKTMINEGKRNYYLYGNSIPKGNRILPMIFFGVIGIGLLGSFIKKIIPKKKAFGYSSNSNDKMLKILKDQNDQLLEANKQLISEIRKKQYSI